mgnify:CR=1 FL=1
MDVKIAIVEDEDLWADTISDYLNRFQKENNEHSFSLKRFRDGDEIVEHYNGEFDLIFMDIEMEFMNGMKAAEIIRSKDNVVEIIFVTNMAKYAIDGYRVKAMDYVLKPIQYSTFLESLKRALKSIQQREEKFICINQKDGVEKISIPQIRYIESHGHRLSFHLHDKVLETTVYSMKEMEEALEPEGFSRCNSGFLVNLKYVTGLKNGLVMIGDEQISVSRSKKQEFMELMLSRMSY